ncbi:MAG: ATP-binding protein, partial [Rikenellaceae bacterium]|nr:ATP-binding protein [Rikenellaceae bacterium]
IIDNMDYYYDADYGDVLRQKDARLKISPFYASSGVQSVLPIMVMVDYFTGGSIFNRVTGLNKNNVVEVLKMLNNAEATDESRQNDIVEFAKVHYYRNTQLFIEEPEQNLFPESQQILVEYLVRAINNATQITRRESSVTLTTHSPYIITAFNVLLKAHKAYEEKPQETAGIIAPGAIVSPDKIHAYYIKEDGTISNIVDSELGMISGLELDTASDIVENKLSLLDEIIYGEA